MEDIGPKTLEKDFSKKETLKVSCGFSSAANEMHPERNEDAVLVDNEENAFGIFDGMGGHAAGEVASTTARDFIFNHIEGLISPDMTVEDVQRLLVDLARQASEAIRTKTISDPKYSGMGTTVSLVKIHKNKEGKFAIVLNIGDSRVYKFTEKDGLEQISIDDDILSKNYHGISDEEKKVIAEHLDEAKSPEDLNEYEKMLFENRNVVAQAMPRVAHYSSLKTEIKTGDRIVITSDGIHDNLTHTEIQGILTGSGSDEDLAKKLVQMAIERSQDETMRSKKDDMTAVVVSLIK